MRLLTHSYISTIDTVIFLFICSLSDIPDDIIVWHINNVKIYNPPLQLLQMFPVYYIFNFLMTTLLILHVIWFTFLVAIVVQVVFEFFLHILTTMTLQVVCADKDNIEDVRSGSESEDDSETDEPRKER